MILLLFTALLLSVGTEATLETDNVCQLSLRESCPNGNEPDGFPETSEDFKNFCNFAIPAVTCEGIYFERCEPEFGMHKEIQEALPVLHEICDEGTHLHNVIVSSLPCFKENEIKITLCTDWPYANEEEAFEKLIVAQGIESISIDDSRCFTPLSRIACSAASAGRYCGQAIKDVVVEIIQRLKGPLEICGPQILEKLPQIVDVFELDQMQNAELENILQTK